MNLLLASPGECAVFKRIAFLALFALSGCTSTQTREESRHQAERALAEATPCCTSYSELTYDPIRPGQRLKYAHDRNLQVFVFDWGKSFAKGFAFESGTAASRMWIESRLLGGFLVDSSVVAHPFVVFLDENHHVITSATRIPFRFTSPLTSSDGMEAEIPLPQEKSSVRYVVVATGPIDGSLDYCRNGDGVLVVGNTVVPAQFGKSCFSVPFSSEGRIGVRFD